MDFMSWLVSLGIFSARETYKKGKINAITRKSEQAQAKIDAWRAKYTDQVLEEQYYAECREKYPELSHDKKNNRKAQRSHEYAWQRLRREFPDVKIPLLLESDFVRPMLAKHGKILM
ncbi:MAG: hypothetical protein LUD79_03695 [Oscillospiraceae bacterium]|nr:hypothetical protein [Oscillospiraceae bacterium]